MWRIDGGGNRASMHTAYTGLGTDTRIRDVALNRCPPEESLAARPRGARFSVAPSLRYRRDGRITYATWAADSQ